MTSLATRLAQGLLASALAAAACTPASAQTFYAAGEGGFWSPLGYASHDGLLAGNVGASEVAQGPSGIGGTFTHRAYLVFDLAAQSAQITAATLRLRVDTYQSVGPGTFQNGGWTGQGNASEPFGVFDVSTPLGDLAAAYGNPGGPLGTPNPAGLAVWNDLGSGAQWGSFLGSASIAGGFVEVGLSAAGVAALNAARGSSIAFGLSFTGDTFAGIRGQLGAPLVRQQITLATQDDVHQLVLSAVPEPATAWLLAPAAALMLARGRRARAG